MVKKTKMVVKTDYGLMQVKCIAECSKGRILQYFRHSLSYNLSLRSLFCLNMRGRFTVAPFFQDVFRRLVSDQIESLGLRFYVNAQKCALKQEELTVHVFGDYEFPDQTSQSQSSVIKNLQPYWSTYKYFIVLNADREDLF